MVERTFGKKGPFLSAEAGQRGGEEEKKSEQWPLDENRLAMKITGVLYPHFVRVAGDCVRNLRAQVFPSSDLAGPNEELIRKKVRDKLNEEVPEIDLVGLLTEAVTRYLVDNIEASLQRREEWREEERQREKRWI